ncbi:hypothetical protein BJX70DRAFT_375538 [Aspergillus crustosus]
MHFSLKALAVLATLLISTTSATATCKVGAAWPDRHDCHNFFECGAGGIPVRKTCGPGTAYSPKIGVCADEYKVPSCHRWENNHSHDQEQGHDWKDAKGEDWKGQGGKGQGANKPLWGGDWDRE